MRRLRGRELDDTIGRPARECRCLCVCLWPKLSLSVGERRGARIDAIDTIESLAAAAVVVVVVEGRVKMGPDIVTVAIIMDFFPSVRAQDKAGNDPSVCKRRGEMQCVLGVRACVLERHRTPGTRRA